MYKKKLGWLLIYVLLLPPLIGCPMYTAVGFKYAESSEGGGDGQTQGTDPDAIEITGETVTLAWNAPSPEIDYYRLVFRIHGDSPGSWLVLQENIVATPSPEYTIDEDQREYGMFDFGVVAKDLESETEESALHTSLDTTAQPDTGWYLIWLP